jgi:AbrB family looped-hinge helix DNA binding protein
MKTATAQVSSKYQMVIPKEVRTALGIKPHDQVLFLIDEDRVYLRPRPDSFTDKLSGLHAHVWRQPTDQWLREERESWEG